MTDDFCSLLQPQAFQGLQVERPVKTIELLKKTHPLSESQQEQLKVLKDVYEQQQDMYTNRRQRISHRIVSVHQTWVRPIVRGKQTATTEFGAKIATSLEDGYAKIERFSWNAFNESQTLQDSCERYKERLSYYPERILTDKIYRNRKNLSYCETKGIHMNSPKLGRPPKDKQLYEGNYSA